MKKIILTLLSTIAFALVHTYAQDIATNPLTWKVSNLTDLVSNQSAPYSCSFATQGSEPIKWAQRQGRFITTFTVSGVTGSWPDVSKNGKVVLSIAADGQIGSLTFEKSDSGTWITLQLSQPGQGEIKNRFTVQQIN